MSDDLISREELCEDIRKSMHDNPHKDSRCKLMHINEHNHFLHMVAQMPTDFDKEKVIEELEDYLFEKYCVEGDEKIAEIVEKGGIE